MLLLNVLSLWFAALLALARPGLGPDGLGPAGGAPAERVGGEVVSVVLVVVGGGAGGRGSGVRPSRVHVLITHPVRTSDCPVPGTVPSVHGVHDIGGGSAHTCPPHVSRVTGISVVAHRVGGHCRYLVQRPTDFLRQTLLCLGWLMRFLMTSMTIL